MFRYLNIKRLNTFQMTRHKLLGYFFGIPKITEWVITVPSAMFNSAHHPKTASWRKLVCTFQTVEGVNIKRQHLSLLTSFVFAGMVTSGYKSQQPELPCAKVKMICFKFIGLANTEKIPCNFPILHAFFSSYKSKPPYFSNGKCNFYMWSLQSCILNLNLL